MRKKLETEEREQVQRRAVLRDLQQEECRQEKEQLDSIKGITVSGVGFVCTGGFDLFGFFLKNPDKLLTYDLTLLFRF